MTKREAVDRMKNADPSEEDGQLLWKVYYSNIQ